MLKSGNWTSTDGKTIYRINNLSVGNPHDQMTRYTTFLKKNISEYLENQALSGGVSTILRSGLILENIRRIFLLSIWDTGTVYKTI